MNQETHLKLKLSHILVEQRYEAEDLVRKLQLGDRFEDLARKYSTCSSAKAGGCLGEIDLRRLDPTFSEAAQKLKPSEISGPVRTRFGYHLIRQDS